MDLHFSPIIPGVHTLEIRVPVRACRIGGRLGDIFAREIVAVTFAAYYAQTRDSASSKSVSPLM